jgi:MFS family permease
VLLFGLGATVMMQATRVLLPRVGSRRALTVAAPGSAVLVAGIGLAPNYPLLLVAATLFGAAFGTLDVSMNAQAAAIERALARHIMNGAHAGWSIGSVSGGAIGALTALFHVNVTTAVTGTALAALPIALALTRTYLPDPPRPADGRPRAKIPRVVYLIGTVTCASFLIEGAVANWSGLYVFKELRASETVAALAYPSLELAMIIGRTFGDRVRAAVGSRAMLITAGLGVNAGMGLSLTAGAWPAALVGFFVIGLAVSTVVPITFSLAGTLDPSGAGIAQAGAMGYAGALLGPVVIGALADATTLRTGLLVVIALGLVVTVVGARLPAPSLTQTRR